MYNKHPDLIEPSPQAVLWRYMDFPRFLSLLESACLQLIQISRFEDPFEGHPPRGVLELFRGLTYSNPEDKPERQHEVQRHNVRSLRESRNLCYASCWHVSDHESSAMWAQYAPTGASIAVTTTFQDMVASIKHEGFPVSGGLVQYVDHDTYVPPAAGNTMVWATLKRKSFRHEEEFRLLTVAGGNQPTLPTPVDLGRLIRRVFVSPMAPTWVLALVNSICVRYAVSVPIVQSSLGDSPAYYPEFIPGP